MLGKIKDKRRRGRQAYGLTFFYQNKTNAQITVALSSTADFWEGTFRPPYDYNVFIGDLENIEQAYT